VQEIEKDGKKSKKKKKDKDKDKKKKKDKKKRKEKDKDKKKKKDKKDKKKDKIPVPEEKVVIDTRREAPGTIHLVLRNTHGMVEKKILKTGHGRKPVKGNPIKIRCTGYLQAGMKKFYSTEDKYGKPYQFVVGIGNVIKGWDDGCLSIRIGEKARITVTGNFGYGMEGFEAWGIPSMADLVFDIEMLAISNEIRMPTQEEIAKKRIANQTLFIDRSGDRMGSSMKFNSAPF